MDYQVEYGYIYARHCGGETSGIFFVLNMKDKVDVLVTGGSFHIVVSIIEISLCG